MGLPQLDPHPFGCPVGLAHTAAEMRELIGGVSMRLRDLLHPTIHVINPSKGAPYAILNLHADSAENRARVVLFPGWEDNKETKRRRLKFTRQHALLKRIVDAGVPGESLEDYRADLRPDDHRAPVHVSLDCTAADMDARIHDLYDYLGDYLRITVAVLTQGTRMPPIRILRLYGVAEERVPRVVLFPGWVGTEEVEGQRIRAEQRAALLVEMERKGVQELAAEVYLAS